MLTTWHWSWHRQRDTAQILPDRQFSRINSDVSVLAMVNMLASATLPRRAMLLAMSQSDDVDVTEIRFRPTQQEY